MSVTLTENRTVYSLGRTLADYDLQHSGEETDVSETPNSRPAPQETGNNPADWADNFRRVPDYRPVDYDLDFAYRDTTQNGIERAFIWNMFSGIVLTSVWGPGPSGTAGSDMLTSISVGDEQNLEGYWRKVEQHILPLAGWRRALSGTFVLQELQFLTAFGSRYIFNQPSSYSTISSNSTLEHK